MTAATISKFLFLLGQADSPETFTAVEEVLSISGFGVTNELIDVTNFDSPNNAKEFIAGLADGNEVSIECNRLDATAGPQQALLKAAVDAGSTRNFRIDYTGVSPDETFSFAAVCLSHEIVPSPTEQNRINFSVKITGNIT